MCEAVLELYVALPNALDFGSLEHDSRLIGIDDLIVVPRSPVGGDDLDAVDLGALLGHG